MKTLAIVATYNEAENIEPLVNADIVCFQHVAEIVVTDAGRVSADVARCDNHSLVGEAGNVAANVRIH